MEQLFYKKKKSERPVDALAVKTSLTHLLTTWNQEMLAHLKINIRSMQIPSVVDFCLQLWESISDKFPPLVMMMMKMMKMMKMMMMIRWRRPILPPWQINGPTWEGHPSLHQWMMMMMMVIYILWCSVCLYVCNEKSSLPPGSLL